MKSILRSIAAVAGFLLAVVAVTAAVRAYRRGLETSSDDELWIEVDRRFVA